MSEGSFRLYAKYGFFTCFGYMVFFKKENDQVIKLKLVWVFFCCFFHF